MISLHCIGVSLASLRLVCACAYHIILRAGIVQKRQGVDRAAGSGLPCNDGFHKVSVVPNVDANFAQKGGRAGQALLVVKTWRGARNGLSGRHSRRGALGSAVKKE